MPPPWLRRVLVALVAVYGLYLAAANAFLNLGGLERVSSYADDVKLRVEGGVSWWPGHVEGRGFHMDYADDTVEMQLDVPEFETQVALHSLLAQKFETERSDVAQVVLRLRFRRSVEDLCAASPGLPRVRGRPDPAAKGCRGQEEPSKSEDDGESGDTWQVAMHDVHVRSIGEAWIERFRIDPGDATIHGRWAMHPKESLTVTVHELELEGARLLVGEQEALTGVHLRLREGRIDEVDPDDVTAPQMWAALTAGACAEVASGQLRALTELFAGRPMLADPPGEGLEGLVTGTVAASLDRGALRSVTATAAGIRVRVRLPGSSLLGALHLDLDARGDEGGLEIRTARATLRDLSVESEDDVERWPEHRIEVQARPGSRIHPDPARAGLELEMLGRASSTDPMLALVPGWLPKAASNLLVDDDAPVHAQGTLTASTSVRLTGLVVESDGVRVEGDLTLAPELGGHITTKYGGLSADWSL